MSEVLTCHGRTPCRLRNAKDFFLVAGASEAICRIRSRFPCDSFLQRFFLSSALLFRTPAKHAIEHTDLRLRKVTSLI
jgi:hypothetical protein